MAFHIDGLLEHGDEVPQPTSTTDEALAYHVAALAEMGELPSEMDTATEIHVSQAEPDENVPVWRIGDGPTNNEDMVHQQFRHADKPGALTMSGDPDLDIPSGTFNNIIRQALGWTENFSMAEFFNVRPPKQALEALLPHVAPVVGDGGGCRLWTRLGG